VLIFGKKLYKSPKRRRQMRWGLRSQTPALLLPFTVTTLTTASLGKTPCIIIEKFKSKNSKCYAFFSSAFLRSFSLLTS